MKKNGKIRRVTTTGNTKPALENFQAVPGQPTEECRYAQPPSSLFELFGQMEEQFGLIEATFGNIEDTILRIFANPTVAPENFALPFHAPMDISESDSEWLIEVEMPGVQFDDIKVEVQRGTLYLQAMPRQSPESNGELHYRRRERHIVWRERKVSLPEGVAQEKITCDYTGGILRCHIPKEHAAATRHPIPVTPENPVTVAPGDS